MEPLLAFAGGVAAGAAAMYLLLVGRLAHLRATLEAERERNRWTEEAKDTLARAFQLLVAKNVEEANTRLAEAARRLFERLDRELRGELNAHSAELRGVVEPLRQALKELSGRIEELERQREGAYQALAEQLRLLKEEQGSLREAAVRLQSALRSERVRGYWGELQLRRIVELAGMQEHVDFVPQATTDRGRPDLIVRLPGGGEVAVDAKAPMNAFLEAQETGDPRERAEKLKAHARALRDRIKELAEKRYWEGRASPELVVVFVPSEAALQAAFEADPDLFEEALRRRVLPASPVTLLALLKSIAYGWHQHRLSEEARRIAAEASELISRFATFGSHLGDVGRRLRQSVEAYNRAVGSFERRLLPLAERIAEGIGRADALDPPDPVETEPKPYRSDDDSPK